MKIIKCAYCGIEMPIYPYMVKRKYCSKECAIFDNRKGQRVYDRLCVVCNKHFQTVSKYRKHCSPCSKIKHPSLIVRTQYFCPICGKDLGHKSIAEIKQHRYCSRECRKEAENRRLSNHRQWYKCKTCGQLYLDKVSKPPLSCPACRERRFEEKKQFNTAMRCLQCGEVVKRTLALARRRKGTFCSKECWYAYARKGRQIITVTCRKCGKEYKTVNPTYVCPQCAKIKHPHERIERACRACGKIMSLRPSSLQVYCGPECRDKRVTKICKTCGKEYREAKTSRNVNCPGCIKKKHRQRQRLLMKMNKKESA